MYRIICLLYQSGYYNSTVTATSGSIGVVETLSRSNRLSGYGSDTGGGRTAKQLVYLAQRFGPVTSFSGSYRADRWTLNINRSAGPGTVLLHVWIIALNSHFTF